MQKPLPLEPVQAQPEHYHLPPDKRLAGNPRQTVWMQYQDPHGKFFVGIWESEPGKWSVDYTEEEYFQVEAGSSVVTDTSGSAITVSAGSSMVIPRGFRGTWEVLETTRKRFVIYEPGDN
ncbi:MAG: cupin domain-containing protein [Pseudomonadales bacterium]|nr:cupin domain-containing protein [Pseudomonadales bacterium]